MQPNTRPFELHALPEFRLSQAEAEAKLAHLESLPPVPAAEILPHLDLTTLQGDDTTERVKDLCAKALAHPVAAVCVYPAFIGTAHHAVRGSGIQVATVAGGFPHGLSPLVSRVHEVQECVDLGADEIDIVIRREHALKDHWGELYDEVHAMKNAAGRAHLKVILATGELADPNRIYRASLVALMAGADFIKTSTGKESVNATLWPAGFAMTAALLDFQSATGQRRGLKPAGGIRTHAEANLWMHLVRTELGEEWVRPERFRIGASGLFDALTA
ncbi:MAG TPA: deoxyribose-phosphate aldolase [Bacteroidetes bacterium]|nr:deoxyribose-phosphate aldolase [Bacteroidota bacterium]